jgi:hypothetical protein
LEIGVGAGTDGAGTGLGGVTGFGGLTGSGSVVDDVEEAVVRFSDLNLLSQAQALHKTAVIETILIHVLITRSCLSILFPHFVDCEYGPRFDFPKINTRHLAQQSTPENIRTHSYSTFGFGSPIAALFTATWIF